MFDRPMKILTHSVFESLSLAGSASHNAGEGAAIWGQVQADAGGQGGQGGAGQ